MVFEKTARKREEAAASAAIQATKPAFEKIGNGLEYLKRIVETDNRKTQEWKDAVDKQQGHTTRHIKALYDRTDEINDEVLKERRARETSDEVIDGRIERIEHRILTRCTCGALLTPLQVVCHECGTISPEFPYNLQQLDVRSQCLEAIVPLSETIQEKRTLSEEYPYKTDLADEIFTMEEISAVTRSYIGAHNDNLSIYRRINKKANDFLSNCKNRTMEIAVVGNVKAGKSSLINALLGGNMASVDATPETSVLAKYRTTEDKNYIKVTFYKENKWEKLWGTVKKDSVFQNEYEKSGAEKIKGELLGAKAVYQECSGEGLPALIREWTSSDSPKHFFVEAIEIGYKGDTFPHDVVLVDTPGLRDPVTYRSEITRRYIKNSNCVLACIANENLSSKDEFEFLARVKSNCGNCGERILVVATKADMLDSKECEAKQSLFLKQVAQMLYEEKEGLAANHFVSTSAELHTFLTDYLSGQGKIDMKKFRKMLSELEIYDLDSLDISRRSDDIYKFAGVKVLLDRMNKLFLKDRRKYLVSELKSDYQNTIKTIQSMATAELIKECSSLYNLVSDSLDTQQRLNKLDEELNEIAVAKNDLREIQKKLKKAIKA